MSSSPIVVSPVQAGDPPFRIVQIDGQPVGVAYDLLDVVRIAHDVGRKHVDFDDPHAVRWLGGGKYHWSP